MVPGSVDSDEEMQFLAEVNDWVVGHGLPGGTFEHELADAHTGQPLAVFDLAWPNGLQEGLSQPVVLLMGESLAAEEAANSAGYRFFTGVDAFKQHVRAEVLAQETPLATA